MILPRKVFCVLRGTLMYELNRCYKTWTAVLLKILSPVIVWPEQSSDSEPSFHDIDGYYLLNRWCVISLLNDLASFLLTQTGTVWFRQLLYELNIFIIWPGQATFGLELLYIAWTTALRLEQSLHNLNRSPEELTCHLNYGPVNWLQVNDSWYIMI